MDVYVYTAPLPGRIRETVTVNEDGSYTVFIKESLSPVEQARAFAHAYRHIERNHFEMANVQEIEKDARKEDV